MQETGYSDSSLFNEVVRGFELCGQSPVSQEFLLDLQHTSGNCELGPIVQDPGHISHQDVRQRKSKEKFMGRPVDAKKGSLFILHLHFGTTAP